MKRRFNKLQRALDKLHLEKKARIRLIELLMVVGALVATLNQAAGLIWMYMLFALFAVLYFIVAQKGVKDWGLTTLPTAVVAAIFAGLVTANLFISIPKVPELLQTVYQISVYQILLILYWGAFTFIIYSALEIR